MRRRISHLGVVLWLAFVTAAQGQPPQNAAPAQEPGAAPRGKGKDAPPPRTFDDAQIRAAGLRKLTGKHITLYTDVGSSPAVDELPKLFDLAFPQWCQYLGQDEKQLAEWRVNGFLMADKQRFRTLQLLPDNLPEFLHGYARGHEIWMNEQTTDYYRRHLVLHEGTHAFMRTQLGSCGPPWYMEGMAELLGTHRWRDGKLTLGVMPGSRDETPGWGRIKIVKDAVAAKQGEANQGHSLALVLAFDPNLYLKNEPYGWSWAAAAFFDGNPKYRQRFREAFQDVTRPDFNARFQVLFKDDWAEVNEEWQLFVATMEYGHDLTRTAIDFKPGKPLAASGAKVTIAADHGWQSSGVVLEAGKKYRLRASGRYQIADQPKPWLCEPNGVSIRYYRGLPLGTLVAAIRADGTKAGATSGLLKPLPIGLQQVFVPEQSGTLYLKINDSPAELADNSGTLLVEIAAE